MKHYTPKDLKLFIPAGSPQGRIDLYAEVYPGNELFQLPDGTERADEFRMFRVVSGNHLPEWEQIARGILDQIVDLWNSQREDLLDEEVRERVSLDEVLRDYDLVNSGKRPPQLKVGNDNVLEVPGGYLWCNHCNALTPEHIWDDGKSHAPTCTICREAKYGDFCPNCKWDPPEDILPVSVDWQIHSPDCPIKIAEQKRHNELFHDPENKVRIVRVSAKAPEGEKCDCPTYTVYPQPYIYDYWNHPYASLDCYDAVEWGYKMRCPVCGEIFECQDGNC